MEDFDIDIGSLSLVSMQRMKSLFLQCAADARTAEDEGSERFLTSLAAMLESAQRGTVQRIAQDLGERPN